MTQHPPAAQTPERLLYDGNEYALYDSPLADYLLLAHITPRFKVEHASLRRGFRGTWEITDQHLYLVGLQGSLEDGSPLSVSIFFPDYPERVFSHWYSGMLRVSPRPAPADQDPAQGYGIVMLFRLQSGLLREIDSRYCPDNPYPPPLEDINNPEKMFWREPGSIVIR